MTAKPGIDFVANYNNALRSAAGGPRGYTCPLCNDTFQASPKLWAHARQAHQDALDIADFEEESEAKRQFLEDAKAQYKAGPSMEHENQDRPHSAPGERRRRTQLSRSGDALPGQETFQKEYDSLVSTKSPCKSGFRGVSHSPSDKYKGDSRPFRSRHAKQPSGGNIHTKPSDTSRQQTPQHKDFAREGLGPTQPLNNPHTDQISGKGSGRDHDQGLNRTGPRLQPLPDSFSPQREPKLTNMEGRQPEPKLTQNRSLMQHPSDNLIENITVDLERDRQPSPGGFPPVDDVNPEPDPEMLLQPETRPISHEQLVIEVKGIYAGLVMVEAKCIDIDEKQTAAAQEKDLSKRVQLKNDQYQSLIALHKQLLHEHHDFFLASQHPSASPALSRLAAKYSMPARMWRHGIHAFLEVLRYRLPESLEHMLAFIYIAYSMMALLYETVSTFEDTWIECLGDLGRYRMAIEDDDPKDRETWSNVARFWYNKAADKTPNIGRLYHHLAILARPYSLEQLSLYTRSLTCVTPFESARGSIMTLFNPILQGTDAVHRRSSPETTLIRAHGLLFTIRYGDNNNRFIATVSELEKDGSYDKFITKSGPKFKEIGVYAAVSNIAALYEYGTPKQGRQKPILRLIYEDARRLREKVTAGQNLKSGEIESIGADPKAAVDVPDPEVENLVFFEDASQARFISQAWRLTSTIVDASLKRPKDRNVQPLVNVYLAFLWSLVLVQETCKYLERALVWRTIERNSPWRRVCFYLNELAEDFQSMINKAWTEDFPIPESEKGRPLLEDYIVRGQLYTLWLFPSDWFTNTAVDDDERTHDPPSMVHTRVRRILWLGYRIASANRWIRYDRETMRFEVTDYINDLLEGQTRTLAVSRDEDSIMSYDEPLDLYTPRTESIAPSDSHDSITEYTPRSESLTPSELNEESRVAGFAPTPMDLDKSVATPGPIAPEPAEFGGAVDSTPVIDLSPGKDERPVIGKSISGEPKLSAWTQSSFLSFDLLSDLAKNRGDEYLPNREQVEGLAGDQSRGDAETYRP